MDPTRPANRLARETSPYLLQHAHNPVDWHPWGPEALERARREDKPIFLSIGYSACHWCHVMERESFEDPAVAARMNHWFVNVKVDREERPDLDEIYMKAVQAMTGSGGWPMSVFLTPSLEPFFGGTYFPPRRQYGRPSFLELVETLGQGWSRDRASLEKRGRAMAESIAREGRADLGAELDPGVLDRSLAALVEAHDPEWGGFGGAPKFPHAMDLRLLLRHHLRTGARQPLDIALTSLDRMAEGGIHDQLGGGFHRYSTDERWLVPHFEKMLYDNALLVPAYLEAHLATGEPRFAEVARAACEWVLREMVTPEGGFASSQDADTEGEEGRYFVWTVDELRAELGTPAGDRAAEWFGATDEGNWEEGRNVLWRHEPAESVAARLRVPLRDLQAEMREARARLLAARERRVRPATDDKVLAAWNGLMIGALARAHQVLDEPRYLEAAARAASYVLGSMRRPDGRLHATARGGRAHLDGYLDDHVFVIAGLLDLYESDFDPRWIREALALAERVEERFADADKGGHFTTASDHEPLPARLKAPHDGALPSGNAVHALNLLRLAELCGRGDLARRAERTVTSVGAIANRHPAAMSQLLLAVDFLAAGPREVVVAGDPSGSPTRRLLREVRRHVLPQRVVALAGPGADEDLMPILQGKDAPAGGARAYVCRNYACGAPADTPEALREQLGA